MKRPTGKLRNVLTAGVAPFALASLAALAWVPHASAQLADDDSPEIIFADESDEGAGTVGGVLADAEADDSAPDFGRLDGSQPLGVINATPRSEAENPYAAEGIRLGNFIFRPSLEIGLSGALSNNKSAGATPGSIISETDTTIASENAVRLLINSDWSRHSLEVELSGIVPVTISGDAQSPTYGALADLQLELGAASRLQLEAGFSSTNDDPQSSAYQIATDPVLNPGVTGINDPATLLLSGKATLSHDFGGLTTAISAAIGRLQYSQAKLSDGSTVSQSDLNATDYDFTLRGGYALSGVFSPFVEASYGMRVMDENLDASGVNRNATRYGLRLGTEIDMGEKFGGEISIGYAHEKLDDASFEAISAVTLAAELNWSPVRNTDVTFAASTEIEPSGLENIAGSTIYATELGLTHRLRENLTATANLAGQIEDFSGPRASITTLGAGVGLTYDFNRYLALTGRLSYAQDFSGEEELRGNTTQAFVGLRLQR